jgi:hypothetical protein
VKRELEKLLRGTAQVIEAWESMVANENQLPADGLRPSFISYSLACAMAEMEELLVVHETLWPKDSAWREHDIESIVNWPVSMAEAHRKGAAVAEEDHIELALARPKDVDDLFYFFCQVRQSILYLSTSTEGSGQTQGFSGAVDTAMETIQGLNRAKRSALEAALTAYISNSFILSSAKLSNGAVLGERYWPLFRAVQLLQGETYMNQEKISGILEDAGIKPETRNRVDALIDALRRMLENHDLDWIREILASGGKLFPGLEGNDSIVIIPGSGHGQCSPIVLAIAKGRDGRSRYGLPKIMREVRAHLIQCFETAEVVILLTDIWDPDLMKESEPDFSAYASRRFDRKVLIPLVSWKRELTPYSWPR